MRAYLATFIGSFFIALVYATKSPDGPVITIARSGDTALVVQKNSGDSDGKISPPAASGAADPQVYSPGDSLMAPDATVAAPPAPGNAPASTSTGSSSPVVIAADLDALKAQGMIIPVAGVTARDLTDSFDEMRGGTRRHNAIDIMAARNTPVLAATSGQVIKLHNSTAGGLTIYTSDPTSKFVMMYGHLNSYRPGLTEKATVKRGEIIGFVGSTGNANPLAPHLHFQITRNDNLSDWWKGTALNPYPVLHPK